MNKSLKVYKKTYTIVMVPDNFVGGYTVTVDGVPEIILNCFNEDESMKQAKVAILAHLKLNKMTTKNRYLFFKKDCEEKQQIYAAAIRTRDAAFAEWSGEIEAAKQELSEIKSTEKI